LFNAYSLAAGISSAEVEIDRLNAADSNEEF